jgi:hypothetical protein
MIGELVVVRDPSGIDLPGSFVRGDVGTGMLHVVLDDGRTIEAIPADVRLQVERNYNAPLTEWQRRLCSAKPMTEAKLHYLNGGGCTLSVSFRSILTTVLCAAPHFAGGDYDFELCQTRRHRN